MFIFYGAVRGAPAVTPFPQVLRITMPSQETGNGPVNNHGTLVWAGIGAGLKPSEFNSGEWTVTFTRGELNKSSYSGTDTTTDTVTAVINRTTGSIRFVYLNKGYVAEGANCYMQEHYQHAYRTFPTGEDMEGRLVTDGSQQYTVEFVPPELYGSETGFTDPPEGQYTFMEVLEETESGGSTMAEVNEILVKSYLNLERNPVNDYHAASKNYVDTAVGGVNSSLTTHTGSTSIHVPTQNTAGYVFLSDTTATSAGTWTAYGTAGTDVASGGAKLVTGGAVYAYLNSNYSAFSGKSLATSVASGNGNPVTSGAVYTYVQNTVLNKSGSTGATALASSDDTKAPSSKLVAQYVAAQISAAASDYAGAEHQHSGDDITSGTVAAARLPSASTSAKGIVQVGSGLTIPSSGDDSGKLTVSLGNGLEVSSGAVKVKLQSSSGLTLNANGLKVDTSSIKGDFIGTTQGKAPALDSAGKLSIDVMPARVIGGEYLGEVANETAMIGKTNATVGDFVKRTDKGTYWMLGVDGATAYGTAANWFEYAGAVASVNGQIGTVSLTASDVSAIATSALVTAVASTSTDATVPSALAVYSFVNGNYAAKSHNHNASAINAGTLGADRLPAATTSAKGAVIVGTGLKVSSGTISADFLAASNGVYDTTNTTKPITAAAAKSIADAAASSATAAAAKGKIFTITGNGTDASFTCTHGLGISNVLVQVYDSTGKQVLVAVEKDTTTVTFKFAAAPASGATFTAVILGVQEAS